MNLQEFINYRECCPICNAQLVIKFRSTTKPTIRYEEDRLAVRIPLDELNKHRSDYIVSYTFGLNDNSFYAEFYTKESNVQFYAETPKFLRDRFLDLHRNLKYFSFNRRCTHCEQYEYSSRVFDINLKNASYEPLQVWSESICYVYPLDDGSFRKMDLINILGEKASIFSFWKSDSSYISLYDSESIIKKATEVKLPLIPFVSKEETFKRLNNLIIFT